MLRPEPMSRVLVVGPRGELEPVIETLHDLRLVHLIDHRGEDEVFAIGKPLTKASEVSENLVKLRSIANILELGERRKPETAESLAGLRQRIVTLEVNLREEDEARKKIEGLLQDLNRQIEEVRPFAALGLPLDVYRGYERIDVLVGRVSAEVRGLDGVTTEYEMVTAEGLVAVFLSTENAEKVREFLGRFGFAPIDVPKEEGDPKTLLSHWEAERDKWTGRLADVEGRIAKLRERYAKFIVAAEDALQVEIEKAEAPLRFAVSEHSFVVDGWVPTTRTDGLRKALTGVPGLHVEAEAPRGHAEEEPPVLLRNPRPVRRFEFLTNLYSTPRHDEVDPTAFLFLLFPIFFGLMIGDAGYGLVMIAVGFVLAAKFRDSPDFSDFWRVVLFGGVFAYAFGLLLYGEIFGIPFHPPVGNPDEVSWSAILGFDIPYSPPIHKLEDVGVIDLLLLSIVASFFHLGAGYVVGFVNEIHHDRKHAASRIGWLFVLIGLFAFFAVLARTPPGVEPSHRVVNQLFLDRPPFMWIPPEGFATGGLLIPNFTLITIGIGIFILLPTEGGIAPVETISLLANMMSYTRLAGVAVAKGAVALAFNTMLLPLIIDEPLFVEDHILQLNPNPLLIVAGFVVLFFAHAIVLVFGGISAGIQAIRLNYVEFFLKFFKGGGQLFSPFGMRTTRAEV